MSVYEAKVTALEKENKTMTTYTTVESLGDFKVKELKELSRERGLKLEHKGHKFTKKELIERIIEHDSEQTEEGEKVKTEKTEEIENVVCEDTATEKNENKGYIFAKTLKQIAEKYSYKKPEWVYEDVLQVGSTIVFIHYVEAKDQNIYKKLRYAKVTAINRKQRLVRVQTFYGTEIQLGYDELLFIAGKEETTESFPKDIRKYIKNHRTNQGRKDIHDRYISSNNSEE